MALRAGLVSLESGILNGNEFAAETPGRVAASDSLTFCENDPMKVVSSIGSLKHRHPDCQVVRRRGRIYVICKSNPRFKVRQGGAKVKKKRR